MTTRDHTLARPTSPAALGAVPSPAGVRFLRAKGASFAMVGVALAAASVALIAASSSRADPPATGVLTVRISALRSSSGQVGCTIYDSPKGFPGDATAALQRRWCPIANAASACAFDPLPAGVYAVACFHDENKNGKLDTGLFGIPKEGTVVSNHAKGFMGPPSFKDAKFSFDGTARDLPLRMGY
jgi:uncharacterized protein (DUF2141 family)